MNKRNGSKKRLRDERNIDKGRKYKDKTCRETQRDTP